MLPELRVRHHGGATIQKRGGTLGTQQLALLFSDLLRCVALRRGPAAARRAARALRAGVVGRLCVRSLRKRLARAAEREVLERDSALLRAALQALGSR